MKDVGDDRLNYNDPQDVAEGEYFDWGFWDDEPFNGGNCINDGGDCRISHWV